MIRVLLSLCLTAAAVCGGSPQSKAAAAPTPSTPSDIAPTPQTTPAQKEPSDQAAQQPLTSSPPPFVPSPNSSAGRMQTSLEKQRAAVRRQVGDWISIGDQQPNDGFLLPWPKPAIPATSIMYEMLCDPMPDSELDRLVSDASARQKVSPKLVRAIINQESGGRPCAVSSAGAQGLMQLMPDVQQEMAVTDPFDPKSSVEGGVKLLKILIDRYAGNVPKALAAYNAGPGAVDRAGGIPPIPETTNYVSKIVRKIE